MTELTLPLIAAEVDLTDFPFMPLDVRRLRDSDLASLESPEACWAAVLLWAASWHQVPAGSLPDDDRVLSQLAGFGRVVKEWLRVRDGALRSFVKCSDGRLYHPVVVEKAVEAWNGKLRVRWKRDCERIKKYHQRHKTEAVYPLFDEWKAYRAETGSEQWPIVPPTSQGTGGQCPEGQNADVPRDNATMSPPCPPKKPVDSGQGEGKGQGEVNPTQSSVISTPPEVETGNAENPTRKGGLCKRLRALGIDAAPHLQAWPSLLAGYSDEQILSVAEKARESKPGERIHLNYLVPMLADTKAPQARGSPPHGKQALRADYLRQQGYTGGEDGNSGGERIIDGQAERVA